MSLDVQKSSSTCSCLEFFEYVPEVGLLNLTGVLFLIFFKNCYTACHSSLHYFTFVTNSVQKFQFFCILTNTAFKKKMVAILMDVTSFFS